MIGDFIAFTAGLALVVISCLVIRAYWPPRYEAPSAKWLGWAIIFAFAAAGLNALYWQVWGTLSLYLGLGSVGSLRDAGDFFDLVFKGGAAVAGWMHLKALHMGVKPEVRSSWSVWEMPWYPQRRACISTIMKAFRK